MFEAPGGGRIPSAGRSGQLNVLIVDDDRDIRDSVAQLFQFFLPDFPLMSAASTDEAFNILSQRRIDVLISDSRMPGMDGVEFLRQTRRTWPGIPRFLFTAYSDKAVFERARRQADISGVITKPCDSESFRSALEGVRRQILPSPVT